MSCSALAVPWLSVLPQAMLALAVSQQAHRAAGNPLPHLQGLGADVAFPALHCATAPSMPALAASDASLDLSTGAASQSSEAGSL